jgi:hypothetical protein
MHIIRKLKYWWRRNFTNGGFGGSDRDILNCGNCHRVRAFEVDHGLSYSVEGECDRGEHCDSIAEILDTHCWIPNVLCDENDEYKLVYDRVICVRCGENIFTELTCKQAQMNKALK